MAKKILESEIENKAVYLAELQGYVSYKLQFVGKKGAPDRIFFGHGKCVLIEFKRPGQTLDANQEKRHIEIKPIYQHIYVCSSVEAACRVLDINCYDD